MQIISKTHENYLEFQASFTMDTRTAPKMINFWTTISNFMMVYLYLLVDQNVT